MSRLHFVQIEKDNNEQYESFKNLMISYNKELDDHRPNQEAASIESIVQITQGMIRMQGPHDRHLELAYANDVLVGFYYGKVDHIGHKGFIKPEYGYIMEFFIIPEYRNKGYGREMFLRLELLFANHDVKRMYLTADPVTGAPFWQAVGFRKTGEISPENKLELYEKAVTNPRGGGL